MTSAINCLYVFSFGNRSIETNEPCFQTTRLVTFGALEQELSDNATIYLYFYSHLIIYSDKRIDSYTRTH
jgi:hypothetical protein